MQRYKIISYFWYWLYTSIFVRPWIDAALQRIWHISALAAPASKNALSCYWCVTDNLPRVRCVVKHREFYEKSRYRCIVVLSMLSRRIKWFMYLFLYLKCKLLLWCCCKSLMYSWLHNTCKLEKSAIHSYFYLKSNTSY